MSELGQAGFLKHAGNPYRGADAFAFIRAEGTRGEVTL